jgi:prevent-host-death family protein
MVRWQMSEARKDFSTLVERASRGEWQLVGRRARAEVVLADAAEIAELLATAFPFAPEVFVEKTGVEIWLPELEVYGRGSTLAQAKDDLVEAALDLVDVWETELRAAPNQRHKCGHVRRVQLAHDQAQVAEVLFGSNPGDSER